MKSDGDEYSAATQLAQLSMADPARTSESGQSTTPDPQVGAPSLAAQLCDRERYQFLGEHGRGGLGRISRALGCALGRALAIEELISRGQVSEARFLREALITARLEHPGIVPAHESGRWSNGRPAHRPAAAAPISTANGLFPSSRARSRTSAFDIASFVHHIHQSESP